MTPPFFICLVGRQSVDEGGRSQTKEGGVRGRREGSEEGGGVRGRREVSEEGGRGQTNEGGVRMILTSFLVVSVQEVEPPIFAKQRTSHTRILLEFLFSPLHTHTQFSGADSERLILMIKHFLEGKGAYFPGKGHR